MSEGKVLFFFCFVFDVDFVVFLEMNVCNKELNKVFGINVVEFVFKNKLVRVF